MILTTHREQTCYTTALVSPKPTFTPSRRYNNRKMRNPAQKKQKNKKNTHTKKKKKKKKNYTTQLKFEWKNKATHFALTNATGI